MIKFHAKQELLIALQTAEENINISEFSK